MTSTLFSKMRWRKLGWLPRVLRYAIFWVLAYFILLTIFSGSSEWQPIDHIYTTIFMTTLMAGVAVNSWIILPTFLGRKRYFHFCILAVGNVVAFTYFNHLLFDKLIDYILPGYYFISYYDFLDLSKFFWSFVIITTLLQLSMEWFRLQGVQQNLMQLEKEKIDAELKALMNQVNPHFLFNSLSVLYSLSLKGSADAPQAIIQLSDILRYIIYQSPAGVVPIKSEIELIRNYIGLQRYRVHPSTKVSFNTLVSDENLPVIVMVFLPLVENSFKHGVKSEVTNGFVNIELKSDSRALQFNITNSRGEMLPAHEGDGGVGLKNIETRLRLVYKDQYTFTVSETATTFTVQLQFSNHP